MSTFRLKTPTLVVAVFSVLGSSLALAQPGAAPPPSTTPGYYPASPPPPSSYGPGYHRRGLTLGVSLGIGGMDSDTGAIYCDGCDYQPVAGGGSFHIGGMLNPRLALLFEVWSTGKQLDAVGANSLWQHLVMVAAQYWVSPQLWLKGGIGFAHLSLQYDDGYYYEDQPVADGGALMGALGYEVLAGPRFSVDLQLRLGMGSYEGLGFGDQIQSGTFGAGLNWY